MVSSGSDSRVPPSRLGNDSAGGLLKPPPSHAPLPRLQTILLSLLELASSLAHLHSLGIVHCDIKPDDLLLKSSTVDARGFTLKLADFGLSRVQDDDCLTFPCNSCGTLAYVAPEALCNQKVDRSIDVYSFGILMYELYSNRRPYATARQDELMHAVVSLGMRPVFRPGSHAGYVALARACWAAEPSQRPTFSSVVTTLNNFLMTHQASKPSSPKAPMPLPHAVSGLKAPMPVSPFARVR